MNTVILEPNTLTQLRQAAQVMEIRDAAGQVVGHFVPALDSAARSKAEPRIGEEELQRREQAGGGRPLADILADLEKKA
jgi:hypothetical protein